MAELSLHKNPEDHPPISGSLPAGHVVDLHDPMVFKALWHRQQPHLLFLAKRILNDQQAAEDAATDIFIKLWNSSLTFSNELAVIKWLRVATKNSCLNILRQQKGQEARLHELTIRLQHIGEDWNHEDLIAYQLQTLRAEISLLPARSSEIFTMRYLKGMKNEEIARELGLQHQTVRDTLSRAVKQLRLSLKNRPDLLLTLALICAAESPLYPVN